MINKYKKQVILALCCLAVGMFTNNAVGMDAAQRLDNWLEIELPEDALEAADEICQDFSLRYDFFDKPKLCTMLNNKCNQLEKESAAAHERLKSQSNNDNYRTLFNEWMDCKKEEKIVGVVRDYFKYS